VFTITGMRTEATSWHSSTMQKTGVRLDSSRMAQRSRSFCTTVMPKSDAALWSMPADSDTFTRSTPLFLDQGVEIKGDVGTEDAPHPLR